MDLRAEDAVAAAFDALTVQYEDLLKLVEDGGLETYDHGRLVGFLHGWERFRNRLTLVDHQAVRTAQKGELANQLCHPTLPRALAAILRLSIGEASRRVRAAEALTERMSMTGEPLAPVRPHLAAAQRDGEISPEQVDVVERALAKVDRVGFDPGDVDHGEEMLARYATQFGPRDLRRLAERVVDDINPDGTLPDDKLQQDRRHLTLQPTTDGGYAGEFRLTAAAGVKLQAVLGPLAKQPVNVTETADGKRVEEPDERTYGQRMHDALEDVCDRLLRSDTTLPDAGGTPATVIITLDLQNLLNKTGYAVTSNGSLIPTDKALKVADQAEIYWAAVNSSGVPLLLGRTRRIASPGLTAALIARDKGCSFPGCDTGPEWTERHHVIPWSEGGGTDLDNMTLLCRYHHHNFLTRGWECEINPDGLPEWRPPLWVDRDRRPLINNRIRSTLASQTHRRQ
ncbi:MAG TPA: DUF222 domain-containing protein [Propionibacteriaceae bacterium]|nr:DUF222 domain-containing protein [Propionibacteriaceae bacterium]